MIEKVTIIVIAVVILWIIGRVFVEEIPRRKRMKRVAEIPVEMKILSNMLADTDYEYDRKGIKKKMETLLTELTSLQPK